MAADRVGEPSVSPDQPLLAVAGVSKYFGGVRAVENVTVSIRRGEIMSVIGPNGAGKTSLLNMISGFYRPTGGTIMLEGRDITRARPSQIAALGVARTFQNIALFAGLTVLDNIMLGRHVHMRASVLSSFVYWGLAQREELAHRARVEELIDSLELQNIRKQPSAALPYGLRKRVELGRALALEPKMLLLDEPMGGMNQGEKEDMALELADNGYVMENAHILMQGLAAGLRENRGVWRRQSGRFSLLVQPGEIDDGRGVRHVGVPYGSRARLIMLHLQSEGLKSRTISLGHSYPPFFEVSASPSPAVRVVPLSQPASKVCGSRDVQ